MSNPRNRLIDFDGLSEPLSLTVSRQILRNLEDDDIPFATLMPNILDGYEDHGYGPSMAQIEEWTARETKAMFSDMEPMLDAFIVGADDDKANFGHSFKLALDAFGKGELNKDELVQVLAKSLTWLDQSPFWGGTPLEAFWHAAKVQSALFQVYKNSSAIVDVFCDLLEGIITEAMNTRKKALSGDLGDLNLVDLEHEIAQHQEKVQAALRAQEENTSLAVKIGFMYRDAWWLEKHGDAALRGYIAKETAIKAGSGGSKSSTAARRKRLEALLHAHAVMVRDNQILADDPMEENAFRALKLARKAHPDLFGKVSSKKTAVEYWGYIKSDPLLRREYQNILFYGNRLQG